VDPDVATTHQPYQYAGDDPTDKTDPSGLDCAGGVTSFGAAIYATEVYEQQEASEFDQYEAGQQFEEFAAAVEASKSNHHSSSPMGSAAGSSGGSGFCPLGGSGGGCAGLGGLNAVARYSGDVQAGGDIGVLGCALTADPLCAAAGAALSEGGGIVSTGATCLGSMYQRAGNSDLAQCGEGLALEYASDGFLSSDTAGAAVDLAVKGFDWLTG
jgi:hypothetical protein